MLSFHRTRRADDAPASEKDRLAQLPILAVEAYTGHTPESYYAALGCRPPAR